MLKKKKRKQKLGLPPNIESEPTSSSATQEVEEDREIKEPSKKELRLYRDFTQALEVISCDEWNESRPEQTQAKTIESNERGKVCELQFGEDYYVQVRKLLLYFEGWDER